MLSKQVLAVAAIAAIVAPQAFAMPADARCCHRVVHHRVLRRVYRSPIVYRSTTRIIGATPILVTPAVVPTETVITQPAVIEPTVIEPAYIDHPRPMTWLHRTFAPWL